MGHNLEEVRRIIATPGFDITACNFSAYFAALWHRSRGDDRTLLGIIECLLSKEASDGPRMVDMLNASGKTFLHDVLSIPDANLRFELLKLLLRSKVPPTEDDLVWALQLRNPDEFELMCEHEFNVDFESDPDHSAELHRFMILWARALNLANFILKRPFFFDKANYYGFPLDKLMAFDSKVQEQYRQVLAEQHKLHATFPEEDNISRPCDNVLDQKSRKRPREEEEEDVECKDPLAMRDDLTGFTIPSYTNTVKIAAINFQDAIASGDSRCYNEARRDLEKMKNRLAAAKAQLTKVNKQIQDAEEAAKGPEEAVKAPEEVLATRMMNIKDPEITEMIEKITPEPFKKFLKLPPINFALAMMCLTEGLYPLPSVRDLGDLIPFHTILVRMRAAGSQHEGPENDLSSFIKCLQVFVHDTMVADPLDPLRVESFLRFYQALTVCGKNNFWHCKKCSGIDAACDCSACIGDLEWA